MARPIAVAMFTEMFAPSANGVTTSIQNARASLSRLGHRVEVFSAGPGPDPPEPGVHAYGGIAFASYPGFHVALRPRLGEARAHRRLGAMDADIVHLHGPGPMGLRGYHAARRAGLPYVYTYHTLLQPLAAYAPMGLKWALHRIVAGNQDRLAAGAARFLLPSRHLRDQVLAADPGLAPRCVVLPTGVDVARFHVHVDGSAIRSAWGIPDGAPVLLYLGRLGFEKHVDVLVRAFRIVRRLRPDAHLVLAGDGPAKDAVRALAAGDPNVHLPGFVADADVPATYAAADAFVSASDFETQGLTLLEAMATGLPSAVAAAGGYLDVLEEGGNGYGFPPGDDGAAAAAMLRALDAPQSVRRAARRKAIEYRVESMGGLLERTYRDVLAGA